MEKVLLIFCAVAILFCAKSLSNSNQDFSKDETGYFISVTQSGFPASKNQNEGAFFISTKFNQIIVSIAVQPVTNRFVQLLSDFFKPEVFTPIRSDLLHPLSTNYLGTLLQTSVAPNAP